FFSFPTFFRLTSCHRCIFSCAASPVPPSSTYGTRAAIMLRLRRLFSGYSEMHTSAPRRRTLFCQKDVNILFPFPFLQARHPPLEYFRMNNPIFPITIWSHDKHIQAIPRPSPKRALSLQLFCEGIQSSRVALLPSTFTTRPVVAFIANETNGATRLINISDDDVKTKQPSS